MTNWTSVRGAEVSADVARLSALTSAAQGAFERGQYREARIQLDAMTGMMSLLASKIRATRNDVAELAGSHGYGVKPASRPPPER